MTIMTIKVSGKEALEIIDSYRTQYPTTGKYPFIVGDSEDLERLQENAEFNQGSMEEIIQASFNVDLEDWILERRTERNEFIHEFIGKWPGEIFEKVAISLHTNLLNGTIKPEVYLGIATIKEPWQLPAILKYGAWNECPEAEIHCAFHRKWQAEYGAQIVGMSNDVIECVVSNPPTDRQTALDLAWQQYCYCADIVEQGTDSLNNLAAMLMNSNFWYFWWD
jgi:hypothetical protein